MKNILLSGLLTNLGCHNQKATDLMFAQNLYDTPPSCLFEMPNLQVLHLSGNALTGTYTLAILLYMFLLVITCLGLRGLD